MYIQKGLNHLLEVKIFCLDNQLAMNAGYEKNNL